MSKPYPLIIGHRGASAIAPENTMAAFRKAIESGADGIEFDVRLSGDGVPVIIHDDTLRRTASRPERVADLSAEELQKIDVGSWFSRAHFLSNADFCEETIPTLQQLLDESSQNDALLYLELKCTPVEISRLVSSTCELLATNSISERVIVECFDLSAIEEVKRKASELKTAALFEPKLSDPTSLISGQTLIERAKAVGADEIALHYRLANKKTVASAKDAGLRVVVWTVDAPKWISQSLECGIDALITNNPGLLVSERAKAGW